MNCLIIEDEFPAAERLQAILLKVAPEYLQVATLGSVREAIPWLRSHPAPDLILSDIQLSDGLSFDIYEQVPVSSPIIFTTAYDDYAIKAFKLNSIDYLLKPVKPQELRKALDKLQSVRAPLPPVQLQELVQLLRKPEAKVYKQRFLVEGKDQLLVIGEAEIAYFMTAHEIVYLVRTDGKRWAVEYTLDQLAEMLDPLRFFRLNRQFIGHIGAIARIHPFFNGKLKLQLTPDPGEEILVSREKAPGFRLWLEGEG